MVEKRQYWVVSPNATGRSHKIYIEDWKQKIRRERIAILGWTPNEEKSSAGRKMGEQFAGIGDPPVVQRDDVILVAGGHTDIHVVAVGVVENDEFVIDNSTEVKRMHNDEPVQKRNLKYFTPLNINDFKSVRVGLEKALSLRGDKALKGPLDLTDSDLKSLCLWLDKKLKATERAQAGMEQPGWLVSHEESDDHRELKQWCAKHPEELELSDIMPGQTVIDQPLSNLISDAPDVVFKRQGDRWAVVEV